MGFYSDLAAMVQDLLAPDAAGGLGQGTVVLTRRTPGSNFPARPWMPVYPDEESETLRAAVSGAQGYADGVTVLATDLRIIAAVPSLNWRPGGEDEGVLSLSVDGRQVTIIRVRGIPEAGEPAAVEFIARG